MPATEVSKSRLGTREDLQRSRHRLGKLLCAGASLRRPQLDAWTPAVDLGWDHEAERHVVEDYLLAIAHLETRLGELDARLADVAETEPYREQVGWLRCFRGIDTLTAILILAELHDFRRSTAPALMAYVGLVPSEDSSGDKHRRGRITKTGNTLVRRLLVETASALSASAGHRGDIGAPPPGATGARDCDCRHGPTAAVSTLPQAGGDAQAPGQGRGRDRPRAGRLPVGRAPTGADRHTLRMAQTERTAVTAREDGG